MAEDIYIERHPGDLVTAEDWNDLQKQIKGDIAHQIEDAVAKVDNVPNAGNAGTLENQTADELTASILEKVRQELPLRTGYRKLFLQLEAGEEKVVKHDLETYPLVDIYQLEPFDVVCSEDDQKEKESVYFYLYHSSEQKIRFGNPVESVEIEPAKGTPYRIAFADMLALYKVQYTNASSLEDLETEFWDAFFAPPNERFDDDLTCHSPWFDRCCGAKRTVGELKQNGSWDEIWFKVKPHKTINYAGVQGEVVPAPPNVEVRQFDFNTLGLEYVTAAAALTNLKNLALLKV